MSVVKGLAAILGCVAGGACWSRAAAGERLAFDAWYAVGMAAIVAGLYPWSRSAWLEDTPRARRRYWLGGAVAATLSGALSAWRTWW